MENDGKKPLQGRKPMKIDPSHVASGGVSVDAEGRIRVMFIENSQ